MTGTAYSSQLPNKPFISPKIDKLIYRLVKRKSIGRPLWKVNNMDWKDKVSNFFTHQNYVDAHVVFIHGAGASSSTFNWIREKISLTNFTLLEYDNKHGFFPNLARMEYQLKDKDNIFFVAHSLGGIYALHLYSKLTTVIGAVTMATPYGGSRTADWASMALPRFQLFHDVGTKSQVIKSCEDIAITIPWTQIVTTLGDVPYHSGKNDGVVTYASMTKRKDMDYVAFPYNHFEIVVAPEVPDVIADALTLSLANVNRLQQQIILKGRTEHESTEET